MKGKIFNAVQIVTVMQMNHWFMTPIAYLFLVVWKSMSRIELPFPYILWGISGLIPIVLFLIRKKVRKIAVSFFLHLLTLVSVPIVMFLAPQYWALYTIFLVLYIVYSVSYKLNADKPEDGMSSAFTGILIMGIAILLLYTLKEVAVIETLVLWMIPLSGLYFICFFMTNMQKYIFVTKDTVEKMPQNRIAGRGLTAVITFAVIVMILGFFLTRFEEVGYLAQLLRYPLRWIIMGILFLASLFPDEENLVQETMEDFTQGFGGAQEESLLGRILEYVFTIILIFILMYIVYILARKFWEFIRQKKAGTIIEEEGVVEVSEKCEIERTGPSLREFFRSFTTEEKIRRIYKKTLIANQKKISGMSESTKELGYYTAQECARVLGNEPFDSIYEKARYSEAGCSAQDLREMKRLSKDL